MGTNTKLLSYIHNSLDRFLSVYTWDQHECHWGMSVPTLRERESRKYRSWGEDFFEWFYMSQAHFSDPCFLYPTLDSQKLIVNACILNWKRHYYYIFFAAVHWLRISWQYWQYLRKLFLQLKVAFILQRIVSSNLISVVFEKAKTRIPPSFIFTHKRIHGIHAYICTPKSKEAKIRQCVRQRRTAGKMPRLL